MFIVPLALFLLVMGQDVSQLLTFNIKMTYIYVVVVIMVIAALILLVSKKLRQKITGFVTKFIMSLRELSSSPKEIGLAAAMSLGITLTYIGCLYASMEALGISASLTLAVIVYASAIIAKTAIPTPGGLGPVEVAMAASLHGFGVVSATAYATVVLYRLATFWIPIPFSLLAYKIITKKRLI